MKTPKDIMKELIEAAMNVKVDAVPFNASDEMVVVCMRVESEEDDDVVNGAVVGNCVTCNAKIWVAPSTRRLLAQAQGNAKVRCLKCVQEIDAKRPDFRLNSLTPSQALEIAQETDISKDELRSLMDDDTFLAALDRTFSHPHRPRHDRGDANDAG